MANSPWVSLQRWVAAHLATFLVAFAIGAFAMLLASCALSPAEQTALTDAVYQRVLAAIGDQLDPNAAEALARSIAEAVTASATKGLDIDWNALIGAIGGIAGTILFGKPIFTSAAMKAVENVRGPIDNRKGLAPKKESA